eukprot:TRINITY_DN2262_c0_g1_i1.p1 TRINITY_DN2262_c0_g1~~TRINITY_DN2262_c0_g1_i1.p1  ORF type:complete len:1597 (-),score=343.65 TRINITY_DN2262_c0_g1_i1:315-5105(-)
MSYFDYTQFRPWPWFDPPGDVHQATFMDLRERNIWFLPESIGALQRIQQLSLGINCLSTLPDTFSNLTTLVQLWVGTNDDPMYYYKGGNQFVEFPDVVTNLSNLEVLGFGKNKLEKIPDSISALSNLTFLSFAENKLSSVPESIKSLAKLQVLQLQKNSLTAIPLEFTQLTNLKSFDCTTNNLPEEEAMIWEHYNFEKREIVLSDQGLDTFPVYALQLNPQRINLSQNAFYIQQNYRRKQAWETECEEKELDPETAEGRKLYPTGFPPQLCLYSFDIVLTGNPLLPGSFTKEFPAIIRDEESNPCAKALKVLGLLKKFPKHDPILATMYEDFAIEELEKMIDDQSKQHLINASLLDLAVNADALDFLSVDFIKETIDEMWSLGASLKTFLTVEKQRPSWFSDGYWLGFGYLFQAVHSEFPKFAKSPQGKYYLAGTMYLLFLVLLMLFCYNMNTTYQNPSFYFTDNLRNSFSTEGLSSPNDFWSYLSDDFLPSLLDGPEARDVITPENQAKASYSYYRPVGGLRLRQLRSVFEPCRSYEPKNRNPDLLDAGISPYCVRPFGPIDEDRNSFGPDSQYQYMSMSDAKGYPLYGQLRIFYPGGGYLQYLSANITEALEQIEELQSNYWVDLQTRAVVLEFLVANDNLDLLSSMSILYEFPVSGSVLSTVKVHTIPRLAITKNRDVINSVAIFLLIFGIGYFLHEFTVLLDDGMDYFDEIWNKFDITLIVLLFSVLGIQFHMTRANPTYNAGDGEDVLFEAFKEIANLWAVQRELLAVLVFMSWIRLLYFFSIDEYLGPMLLIIGAMTFNIVQFLILLLVFLLAFGGASFVIYGTVLQSYSTPIDTAFSIGNFLFGNFDFDAMNNEDNILGPILFFVFLIMCIILLMNFLIAILSGTYEEIQSVSEKKYTKIMATTLLSALTSPPPPPTNLVIFLTPVWIAICRIYPYFAPIVQFVSDWIENSIAERNTLWYYIWTDSHMERKLWGKWKSIHNAPKWLQWVKWPQYNTDVFLSYRDLYDDDNQKKYTRFTDHFVYGLSWFLSTIFTLSFRTIMGPVSAALQFYKRMSKHYMGVDEILEVMPKKQEAQKNQNDHDDDDDDEVNRSIIFALDQYFRRFLVRLIWVCTTPLWVVCFFWRFYKRRAAQRSGVFMETHFVFGEDYTFYEQHGVLIRSKKNTKENTIISNNHLDKKLKFNYFEIEIINPGEGVYIGLCTPGYNKEQRIGVQLGSISASSKSGDVNIDWIQRRAPVGLLQSFHTPNTVVGCGIDPTYDQIYFTKNGSFGTVNIKFTEFAKEDEVLHPALSLTPGAAVRVNFGADRFRIFQSPVAVPSPIHWDEDSEVIFSSSTLSSITAFDSDRKADETLEGHLFADGCLSASASSFMRAEILNRGLAADPVLSVGFVAVRYPVKDPSVFQHHTPSIVAEIRESSIHLGGRLLGMEDSSLELKHREPFNRFSFHVRVADHHQEVCILVGDSIIYRVKLGTRPIYLYPSFSLSCNTQLVVVQFPSEYRVGEDLTTKDPDGVHMIPLAQIASANIEVEEEADEGDGGAGVGGDLTQSASSSSSSSSENGDHSNDQHSETGGEHGHENDGEDQGAPSTPLL